MSCAITNSNHSEGIELPGGVRSVVIWGHKLHTHTHSYVHNGFFHAFRSLDIPTYWWSNSESIDKNVVDQGALVITEGQVDEEVPIHKNCIYLLHNVHENRDRFETSRAFDLAVRVEDTEVWDEIESCVHVSPDRGTIAIAWPTDLLPDQVDAQIQEVETNANWVANRVAWVGTLGAVGEFENLTEVKPFLQVAESRYGATLWHKQNVSVETNVEMVRASRFAPAIVGPWQKRRRYVPCRFFKNISYGAWPLTNSSACAAILKSAAVSQDLRTSRLPFLLDKEFDKEQLVAMMEEVRDYHTYVARIGAICRVLGEQCEK